MPTTNTARMNQIANDLEDTGLYTSANSVRAITEDRDRLLAALNAILSAWEDDHAINKWSDAITAARAAVAPEEGVSR